MNGHDIQAEALRVFAEYVLVSFSSTRIGISQVKISPLVKKTHKLDPTITQSPEHSQSGLSIATHVK